MKKIVIFTCFALLITLVACASNPTITENNNGNTSESTETGLLQSSNLISWQNLNVDTEGLSEREQVIVNYFDLDYIYVQDFFSLTKYANIYENANICIAPLVIVKILSADKEKYEAIAIHIDPNDDRSIYYPYGPNYDPSAFNLDGQNLIYVSGKQPTDGTLIAEKECLIMFGRYHGTIQKVVDGKTYTMGNLTENGKGDYAIAFQMGYLGVFSSSDRPESAAKAIFGNDIKLETCLDSSGHFYYLLVTPNNQSNADIKSFLFDYRVGFFPIDKDNLTFFNPSVEWAGMGDWQSMDLIIPDYKIEIGTEEMLKNKTCNVSADFNHLILTTFNQSLKKVYIDYYEIETFNKVWSQEFDGVDVMAFDYTPDNMYLIIDDKLHIISLKDGSAVNEPIFVGQIAYINIQTDGILLLKLGTGDNIAKFDFEGNTLWSIKVDDLEIGDCNYYYDENKTIHANYTYDNLGIKNTGNHYIVQANSIQRLAISYEGEILVREGNVTPSHKGRIEIEDIMRYNENLHQNADTSNTSVATAVVIPSDGINIRSAPSVSAKIVTGVRTGKTVLVLGDAIWGDGYHWYPVEYEGKTGYAAAEFLEYLTGNQVAAMNNPSDNLFRVRKTWSDAWTQKGAFEVLDNAKRCADENPGYFVFDGNGNKVY